MRDGDPSAWMIGTLWTHRRGYVVRVENLGRRRGLGIPGYTPHQMIYYQRVSGPEYCLPATKGVSSANCTWFFAHFNLLLGEPVQ